MVDEASARVAILDYRRGVDQGVAPPQIRTAELAAALCLATDLGMGLPLEYGLKTTLVAMRIADRLDLDAATRRQAYYVNMLFYGGCTVDAEEQIAYFEEGALQYLQPVMFGTPPEGFKPLLQALGAGKGGAVRRTVRAARKVPGAFRGQKTHLVAMCEVIGLLADSLGLPAEVTGQFPIMTERWDGMSPLRRARGDQVPVAVHVAHVAHDAAFHAIDRDVGEVARVIGARSGHAFDPDVADAFCEAPEDNLAAAEVDSVWDDVLEVEPAPHHPAPDVDTSLAAFGAFADLVSPHLLGHSSAVADLAARAGKERGYDEEEMRQVRRAGLIHDLGRVTVPYRVWQNPGALSADDWEAVRLHPYHTERALDRSPYLRSLARVAGCHHERLDGTGYHRGMPAVGLEPEARLLAAADAYRTKIESRAHRAAFSPEAAAAYLRTEANDGRLDADAVTAVLIAAGHRPGPIKRPGGLSDREAQTLVLMAEGLATKQIGRKLGVTAKTADQYIQRTYAKIGVSTRAAAAVYAMTHGYTTWENSHS